MSGLVEALWNNNNEECRCSELSHLLDNESLHTEAIQNGRPKFLFFFALSFLRIIFFSTPSNTKALGFWKLDNLFRALDDLFQFFGVS